MDQRQPTTTRTLCAIALLAFAMVGCSQSIPPKALVPLPDSLGPVQNLADLDAQCPPPKGWRPDPLKASDRHTHQVWISPSHDTAYGVIHFNLPLPVGVGIVHWQFLREMKKTTGEAREISRADDPQLPGLRFVCEGGLYLMRVNLVVRGMHGWAIYAGTIREHPINEPELDQALLAQEHTRLGASNSTATTSP